MALVIVAADALAAPRGVVASLAAPVVVAADAPAMSSLAWTVIVAADALAVPRGVMPSSAAPVVLTADAPSAVVAAPVLVGADAPTAVVTVRTPSWRRPSRRPLSLLVGKFERV